MNYFFIVGWLGAAVVLIGYCYSIYKKAPYIFHYVNCFGSVCLSLSALSASAWPNLFLNIIFLFVSTYGVYSHIKNKDLDVQL